MHRVIAPILLLIVSGCLFLRCDNIQQQAIPVEFLGNWHRLPSGEIAEQADMLVDVRIVQDTVIFNQTVEGMNGIQRIIEKYRFEKSTKQNDSTINIYTVNTSTPAMITLTRLHTGELSIVYCTSNVDENADADYTACNEWGNFSKN